MNILHLSRTMGQGGAERVVLSLATELQECFDVTIVASTGGFLVENLEEMGIHHQIIDDIECKKPVILFKNLLKLTTLIKDYSIQILHVHHRMGLLYAHLLKVRYPHLRIIYTAHNIFTDKSYLYAILLKGVEVVAVGDGVEKSLPAVKSVQVIYNSILPELEEYRSTELTRFSGKKILCVGRLSNQKGQRFLIEALSYLPNTMPTHRVFFVGDGEDRLKLERQAHELGVTDRICFLGHQTAVSSYITDCDFMVLPSLWEGFPLTPIECFRGGKTMIATDIPGTREIVSEKNGQLVEKANAKALANVLVNWLTNETEIIDKSRVAFEEYQQRFSFGEFIAAYQRLYKKEEVV